MTNPGSFLYYITGEFILAAIDRFPNWLLDILSMIFIVPSFLSILLFLFVLGSDNLLLIIPALLFLLDLIYFFMRFTLLTEDGMTVNGISGASAMCLYHFLFGLVIIALFCIYCSDKLGLFTLEDLDNLCGFGKEN